jgi:hypothetical protein
MKNTPWLLDNDPGNPDLLSIVYFAIAHERSIEH